MSTTTPSPNFDREGSCQPLSPPQGLPAISSPECPVPSNRLSTCCLCRVLKRCFSRRKYRVREAHVPISKSLLPPQSGDKVGRKTLVLDLDETLIHSSFTQIPNPDLTIPVLIGHKTTLLYVQKRPGVDEFLQRAAEMYELVSFTASLKSYADPILDQLDPNHFISHRLSREHCVYYNGEYVKDLSRLGRDMSNVVILDVKSTQNSPVSYRFHPANGLPIKSFTNDQKDDELPEALNLLREMSVAEDIPLFLTPYRPSLLRRATKDSQFSVLTLVS